MLAVIVALISASRSGFHTSARRVAPSSHVGAALVRHHAMPVASAPVIALIAVNMNLIITNTALVETVFNIPGGFRYMERALINRDVDLVQALILEATFFIVVANFIADAVIAWLDPRVRESM